MDKLPWANPFGAAFGISYTLRRDKEATIQPKTIHIDERPLFRDVQTSMQGKRTPVHPVQRAPSSRNCCSSSLIPASLHATGETGSRYQLQAHGNQYSMENQTLCLGWVVGGHPLELRGFGGPPGAVLGPRMGCSWAGLPLSGCWPQRSSWLWDREEETKIYSGRGEVAGRHKAKGEALAEAVRTCQGGNVENDE